MVRQQVYKVSRYLFVAPSYRRGKKYDVYDTVGTYITSFGGLRESGKPYEHFRDKIGHYRDYNHNDKQRKKAWEARHKPKEAEYQSPLWFSSRFLW
ncbi:MAG: hypothetical protein Salg2KO_10280 [Salibacteraceae bacterium]